MEHVPTLCALSTVGIAPVGLALGRTEQTFIPPRPTSNKRKAPGADAFRSFSSPIPRPISTAHRIVPSNISSPIGPIVSKKEAGRTALTETPVPNGTITPQWTSLQHERRVQSSPLTENTYPRPNRTQPTVGTTRRTSASWLRRISTSSSIHESASRPTTPSISFSNRSSQPIFPSKDITPNPNQPNKLVKRTTSHNTLRQTPTFTPTFKRPATSHQRTAEFRQQMALQEENESPGIEAQPTVEMSETKPEPSPEYRPYFDSGRSQGSSGQPRKRHTSGSAKSTPLRTIQSDVDQLPTLLMATSIASRPSEDDIDDTEDRPATRMGDDHTVQTSTKVSSDMDTDTKPRHSFSIGEMFSSGSSGWRMSRSESLRKKKTVNMETDTVRHVSSPLMPPPSRGSRSGRPASRLQRRRNITDPSLFKAPKVPPRIDTRAAAAAAGDSISSPLPPMSSVSAFEIELPASTPTFPKTPFTGPGPLSSHPTQLSGPSGVPTAQSSSGARPQNKRNSQAGSDPASTLISDGETRVFTSGDEDSMDFQSDTAYDSLATRATASSHSGLRGPRIETIFDESPPHGPAKSKLVPLEDLIQGGSFSERFSSKSSRPSMREDSDGDDEFSTPVRDRDEKTIPARIQSIDGTSFQMQFPSSPPSIAKRDSGAEMPEDDMDLDENEDWDADDGESAYDVDDLNPTLPAHSARRVSPLPLQSSSMLSAEAYDKQDERASKRSSIFEWSEQQKLDKDALNGSSPRPKTVHGKQVKDSRGGRANGRRGPSALHLRSQSVPVTRDSNAENNPPNGNAKFGTWGLGNKGVSEEWTDDFEFEEVDDEVIDEVEKVETRPATIGKGGMKVPQSIIDRQASVHVQFGQVQELSLLVEELKRLRAQAGTLGLLEGHTSSLWDEGEAIINLATVDEEDDEFRFPRSPGSPTFGFDEFDEDISNTQRNQITSPGVGEGNARRNSVLRRSTSGPATPPTGRPRGESAAQARSFLQNMYHNRSNECSPEEIRQKAHDKLPFDTQDLRNLVTRAGVLTRALKELVRKAEGVTQSPDNSPIPPRDPPFSQIFNNQDTPTKQHTHRIPKSPSAHSYLRGSVSPSSESEITGHMKLMTVV